MAILTEQSAAQAVSDFVRAIPPYAGQGAGRGVVVPAGGIKYFPSAWICISLLRHVGCTLPVELWYLGPQELSDEMRALIEPLGVCCVDALRVRERYPARILGGWELKAYAILHSCFEEVLLLDADNVSVRDPTFLFETPAYLETGAIFWPDYGRFAPDHPAWRLTGVEYRDEPEFESGQVLVHKRRCWEALQLTMWMNEHSDFWYRYVHGDKDTFHLSWRRLNAPYGMPSRGIESLPGVMCQHDLSGRRLFQHRNGFKWQIHAPNVRILGFLFEDEAWRSLDALSSLWKERPFRPFDWQQSNKHLARLAELLCGKRWRYRRVGTGSRLMDFGCDGYIKQGAADCEWAWDIVDSADGPRLHIIGRDGITCRLRPDDPAHWWDGHWGIHEKSPVQLFASDLEHCDSPRRGEYLLCRSDWEYHRIGYDRRCVAFGLDGHFLFGGDRMEQSWRFHTDASGERLLFIDGIDGLTCRLRPTGNRRWTGSWVVHEQMLVELTEKSGS